MPQKIYRDFRPARRCRRFLRDASVAAGAAVFGIAAGGFAVYAVVALPDRALIPVHAEAAQQSPTASAAAIPPAPVAPGVAHSTAQPASNSFADIKPDIKPVGFGQMRPLPNALANNDVMDPPAERMRNLFDFFDGSQRMKSNHRQEPRSVAQHRSAATMARIRAAHRNTIAGISPPRT